MSIKNVKSVTDFLGNGIMGSRGRLELNENLEIGTLVGIKDGKFVKATNATGSYVKAVTVITTGSVADLEDPRYYKGTSTLKAGEFHEIYPYFVIQNVPNEEVNFKTAKFGDPVYLGTDGKLTTTKPSGSGTLIQVVGYVGDAIREEVVCSPLAVPSEEATA